MQKVEQQSVPVLQGEPSAVQQVLVVLLQLAEQHWDAVAAVHAVPLALQGGGWQVRGVPVQFVEQHSVPVVQLRPLALQGGGAQEVPLQ